MAWWKEVVEGVICCVRSSVAGEIGGEASQMESQDTAWPIFSHSFRSCDSIFKIQYQLPRVSIPKYKPGSYSDDQIASINQDLIHYFLPMPSINQHLIQSDQHPSNLLPTNPLPNRNLLQRMLSIKILQHPLK